MGVIGSRISSYWYPCSQACQKFGSPSGIFAMFSWASNAATRACQHGRSCKEAKKEKIMVHQLLYSLNGMQCIIQLELVMPQWMRVCVDCVLYTIIQYTYLCYMYDPNSVLGRGLALRESQQARKNTHTPTLHNSPPPLWSLLHIASLLIAIQSPAHAIPQKFRRVRIPREIGHYGNPTHQRLVTSFAILTAPSNFN